MRENPKKSRKRSLVVIIMVCLFGLIGLFYWFTVRTKQSVNLITPTSVLSQPTNNTDTQVNTESATETVTKCQSIVVAPQVTTELYLYIAGKKIRADYRIGASTEEASFKTQILSDGSAVYLWKPPLYFGGIKPENPHGLTVREPFSLFQPKITELGLVERFGQSPLSGDYVCTDWDGVDPVFEVPSDFVFETTGTTSAEITEELTRICQICENANSAEDKSICRKNLLCD